MRQFLILFILLTTIRMIVAGQSAPEHIIVYKEDGRFAGWPANYGIWSWGNEIVTGFFLGYHDDNRIGTSHPINKSIPQVIRQARSIDGGKTWSIEIPDYLDNNGKERQATELPLPMSFTHPDFALLVRFEGANKGFSSFYYSYDRCHTWNGPYKFPEFERKGIFGRTDYIINGKNDMLSFFTAAKDDGREGWPLVVRTKDGGKSWQAEGWIGKQPKDSGFSIMPSTLRLKNNNLLSYVRKSGFEVDGTKNLWMEPYLSRDNGKSWDKMNGGIVNNNGNPPHMVRLKDGRIALTYGCREKPYGIRAKISEDEGTTWSKEIILRDDANNWDIGYVRSAQREDGKIVTAYYFNSGQSKERHIVATIWDPGASGKK